MIATIKTESASCSVFRSPVTIPRDEPASFVRPTICGERSSDPANMVRNVVIKPISSVRSIPGIWYGFIIACEVVEMYTTSKPHTRMPPLPIIATNELAELKAKIEEYSNELLAAAMQENDAAKKNIYLEAILLLKQKLA